MKKKILSLLLAVSLLLSLCSPAAMAASSVTIVIDLTNYAGEVSGKLIGGIRDDVQLTLQTGDLLIGERDTGEIAQVLDFFTCECRHGLNYMSRM